jgi:glyoxylase-like metal-dependent hydrolase (beta-lactamase superfamily II)
VRASLGRRAAPPRRGALVCGLRGLLGGGPGLSGALLDACTGNSKERPLIPEFDHQHRPFLANLTAAGFAPETIDTVVCTHLHVDHVGWNTRLVDGAWVPTFLRARYLFGAADVQYWAQSQDPLHAPAFADSVQPVIDAGLADAVAVDTALTPDVQLRRTPGHTPGHISMWINDRCVITGLPSRGAGLASRCVPAAGHEGRRCYATWSSRSCRPAAASAPRRHRQNQR